MRLHCTVVFRPGLATPPPALEITIRHDVGTTGAELAGVLASTYGATDIRVDGERLERLMAGVPPLTNGAVMVARLRMSAATSPGQDGSSADASVSMHGEPAEDSHQLTFPVAVEGPSAPLGLAIHSGIRAGTIVALSRGRYTIGREGARITIPDPDLSREHAVLVVTDKDITLTDLGSINGSFVDGSAVTQMPISTRSAIRCGRTTMSVVFLSQAPKSLADAGASVSEPLSVGDNVGVFSWLSLLPALLPVVAGVALAAFTGMWIFLAFTAISAFSVLGPLTSQRRQRRSFAAALRVSIELDRRRRIAAGPSLAHLVLAAERSAPGHGAVELAAPLDKSAAVTESDPGGLWFRLGTAPQKANVQCADSRGDAINEPVEVLPVFLDPAAESASFSGPEEVVHAMVRSLVMQQVGYPRGQGTAVVVHGLPDSLPLAGRYLAQVVMTATPAALHVALNSPKHAGVLFLVHSSEPSDLHSDSAPDPGQAALALGWRVLHFWPGPGFGAQGQTIGLATVVLSEHRSALITLASPKREFRAPELEFIPDLATAEVFDRFCRRRATREWRPAEAKEVDLTASCDLAAILPMSAVDTENRWLAAARTTTLAVPLGQGTAGQRIVDLQSDGPHLMVAGTTGSGKSELLRTLVAGLALSYPPDRITFLFVDFKGGSGLGPLAPLVHCVGLLTDLSASELDRMLISLRAEVRRRELLLARACVPDISAYLQHGPADSIPMPHLVIVIDEFRILVDDSPDVLRELMRIAAVGRSLGLHLVMATQRPQGALSADIRANVTSSIALRVQSSLESIDIIGTGAAAGISIDLPGRAFLARGTEAPEEFQTATLTGRPLSARGCTVRLAVDELTCPVIGMAPSPPDPKAPPAHVAAPLIALVQDLFTRRNGLAPHRPVASPLPTTMTPPRRNPCASSVGWQYVLGLLDAPDEQVVRNLVWAPRDDGHLAFVGTAASGLTEATIAAVASMVAAPEEAHFYFLDSTGVFTAARGHHRSGAYVGIDELRRAVRVLERLRLEMAQRLSGTFQRPATPLLLVISGWGSWSSALRAGPLAWAEEILHDVVREGSSADITVLISGNRELVTSRFFGAVPNRLYFPTGSTEDGRLAWPRLPVTDPVQGRAIAFGAITGRSGSAERSAVCQLFGPPADAKLFEQHECAPRTGCSPAASENGKGTCTSASTRTMRPFRIEPLPAVATSTDIAKALRRPGGHVSAVPTDQSDQAQHPHRREPNDQTERTHPTDPTALWVGIGGDELEPQGLQLAPGGVLAVLGRQGSGKSTVLRSLRALNPGARHWLSPPESEDASEYWRRQVIAAEAVKAQRGSGTRVNDADLASPTAVQSLVARVNDTDTASPTAMQSPVALVDDADLASPAAMQALVALHSHGVAVVFTAQYSPLLLQKVPLALHARADGTGLLIAPRLAGDADLFGLRIEVEADSPPGRAIVLANGEQRTIQVAWTEPTRS